ncbi:unnamed protein product, partial [Urochloa humidicola]
LRTPSLAAAHPLRRARTPASAPPLCELGPRSDRHPSTPSSPLPYSSSVHAPPLQPAPTGALPPLRRPRARRARLPSAVPELDARTSPPAGPCRHTSYPPPPPPPPASPSSAHAPLLQPAPAGALPPLRHPRACGMRLPSTVPELGARTSPPAGPRQRTSSPPACPSSSRAPPLRRTRAQRTHLPSSRPPPAHFLPSGCMAGSS